MKDYRKITIKELLKLSDNDIDLLSLEEVKKLTSRAVDFAERRRSRALKAVEKHQIATPVAYRDIGKPKKISKTLGVSDYGDWSTVDFKNVGKDWGEQLKIILRFLDTSTSRYGDWSKNLKEINKRIGDETGLLMNDKDFNTFWIITNEVLSGLAINSKYRYNDTIHDAKSATNMLQRLVMEEMVKSGYNNSMAMNRNYIERVKNSIIDKLNEDYLAKQQEEYMKDSEFEDISYSPKIRSRFE